MSFATPYGLKARTIFSNSGEVLTGVVQNKPASDLEERWARSADALWDGWYVFRQRIAPLAIGGFLEYRMYNLPGELEVDFLHVRQGYVQPVNIQGEIGHFFADWQRQIDFAKEAQINLVGNRLGWAPLIRVPDNKDELYKLSSQTLSDITFKDVLHV